MELKEKLARFREEQELSQTELARELGVTRQAVSGWERGMNAPTTEKLVVLSRLYGVPLNELVSGEPQLEEEPPVAAAEEKPPVPEEVEPPPPEAVEEPEAPPPVDGEAPGKRGWKIAAGAALAACLVVVFIAAVITIWSAIFKEPKRPEDGIVWTEDMEQDYIDVSNAGTLIREPVN